MYEKNNFPKKNMRINPKIFVGEIMFLEKY